MIEKNECQRRKESGRKRERETVSETQRERMRERKRKKQKERKRKREGTNVHERERERERQERCPRERQERCPYTRALSITRLPCPSPHEDPHVNIDPCLVTTALEKELDAIMPTFSPANTAS